LRKICKSTSKNAEKYAKLSEKTPKNMQVDLTVGDVPTKQPLK